MDIDKYLDMGAIQIEKAGDEDLTELVGEVRNHAAPPRTRADMVRS